MADLTTHVWIDKDSELEGLRDRLIDHPRVAIDTEFHRERTYFPELALLQIGSPDGVYLIDPLKCDVGILAPVLDSSVLWIAHAAQQDLEVLHLATGVTPRNLFDTQIASGFIGMSTPSLSALVSSTLGVNLSKGDRLTDWLRRPLTPAQCAYAANDVLHLDAVYEKVTEELIGLDRLGWAEEACAESLSRRQESTSDDAWLRVKDARSLKGEARGVARSVARWRDERARQLNVPVRRVLSDMALVSIAQQVPTSANELLGLRGIDGRLSHGSDVNEILAVVASGRTEVVSLPNGSGDEIDKRLKPAVNLMTAWISELARLHRIDATLLGTRADVDALLRRDESCRLLSGWRRDIVGSDLEDILNGRAGLSFDGKGHLRLIRQ
ncbi:MAG: ribonuclease D [Actinobacteria bacterium]|nr:ribonuclease D [Actinomycetota bacterium]NDC44900.1 ribonuclease D [Actinomycetota bacterium]